MYALYELIDLLPASFEPCFSNRLNELFVYLRSQKKRISEKEALLGFLGDADRVKYFNKLKNRLKREIINYVLVHPAVWVNTDYKAIYDECYRNFTAYKVLLMNGRGKAAIEIAKPLLPKLREVELHELSLVVANDLAFYYAAQSTSPGLSKKYHTIAERQLEIINAGSVVRQYRNQISILRNTRESFSAANIAEFQEAAEATEGYLELGSLFLNRYIYDIILARYSVEFDYDNIIRYVTQAFAQFPKDHPRYNATRFYYYQMKLPAMIALGQLTEAKVIAKESCKMMRTGGFNWHLALIRRTLVCLKSREYQEAYDLYKEQNRYGCDYPQFAEYWKIIWGYLFFLIKMGRIEEYSEERFQLGKFLNEVPIYTRDKAGNNINILIIQILIRMQREQYGQIIDRIDALETYARTYTRNPETVRANIFIKMIIKMSAASFHRSGTERKTQKLLEKLQNTSLKIGQNLSIEIIPYEVLWEEILSMLENKFRGIKVPNRGRKDKKREA
ncbi:MAG: hypothetical protein AAFW73_05720 [Bacteroidota bacterium]